jgi:hypothetical protein
MTSTATVATLCAITVIAIRWLALFGVVRDYAVTRTTGSLPTSGWGVTTSSYHRELGLASGPSAALTHLDLVAWRLGLVAGVFWVLRLGLRSAHRRIGTLRTVGLLTGFGLFVVTGVMHRIDDAAAVHRRADRRALTDLAISLWCFTAVASVVFVAFSISVGAQSSGQPQLGDQAVLTPIGWSIARNALQLLVALGGWMIAGLLTREWVLAHDEHSKPRRAARAEPV